MAPTEKLTISVPRELLARVEERRRRLGSSRSEVVTDLMWRGWHQTDREAREARYREAYAGETDTSEELAWADMAADELFGPAASEGSSDDRERRASG